MLIGIDASRANRAHKSGTEWYSYYLIRWLSKLDRKNQYILYSDKPLQGGLVDLTTAQHACDLNIPESSVEFDKGDFQILKSPHNNFKAKILKWPFNFFWTQGRLSLEMLFKKPNVLFVPAHALPVIHPEKSMVTIHDIGFERDRFLYNREQMGPEGRRKRKAINFFVKLFTGGKYGANSLDYIRWSTKYALKYAEKIITVSDFSKKEILDIYGMDKNRVFLEKKIKVVYNGYNKFLYKKERDDGKIKEVLEKYGISGPFILYIGRLEKKKNTPALIEAFAMMREKNKDIKHKLVLAGDASFGYDEVNYTIGEFLPDQENEVIMPGWVDEADMPYVYSGADVFVFPSLYEGFGIPLLQAMACELPVVASRAVSIPEVVGDAALLFNPRDTKEMTEALEKIITDKNLREELIKRGKERVKNFSWEKCARETLEEIESL
jgi:glycosyltransferase involved in cell wall biosynthesis